RSLGLLLDAVAGKDRTLSRRGLADEHGGDAERGRDCGRAGKPTEPSARILRERHKKLLHRRMALLRDGREPLRDAAPDPARHRRSARRRSKAAVQDLGEEALRTIAGVRRLTIETLIERSAEAPLIAARVDRGAADLLRRHVTRGADARAG